jgi:hypothetical protein
MQILERLKAAIREAAQEAPVLTKTAPAELDSGAAYATLHLLKIVGGFVVGISLLALALAVILACNTTNQLGLTIPIAMAVLGLCWLLFGLILVTLATIGVALLDTAANTRVTAELLKDRLPALPEAVPLSHQANE